MTIEQIRQIREFCHRHHVSLKSHLQKQRIAYQTFHYWERKYKNSAQSETQSSFIELPAKNAKQEIIIESPSGWKMRAQVDLKVLLEMIGK